MNNDINVKALQRNCFRQSKVPGEFMLQMRVPGGVIPAKYLEVATHIAETWGDGNFHIGTRQTLDFPGIKYESIPAVNAYIQEYIEGVDVEYRYGVELQGSAQQRPPFVHRQRAYELPVADVEYDAAERQHDV